MSNANDFTIACNGNGQLSFSGRSSLTAISLIKLSQDLPPKERINPFPRNNT